MRRNGRSLLAVAALALLVSAVGANGAEVTRDTYREAVEPTCKTNNQVISFEFVYCHGEPSKFA